jgi:hypothetical protein
MSLLDSIVAAIAPAATDEQRAKTSTRLEELTLGPATKNPAHRWAGS